MAERRLAWLRRYWRLTNLYERRTDIHQALLTLASILIYWNVLRE